MVPAESRGQAVCAAAGPARTQANTAIAWGRAIVSVRFSSMSDIRLHRVGPGNHAWPLSAGAQGASNIVILPRGATAFVPRGLDFAADRLSADLCVDRGGHDPSRRLASQDDHCENHLGGCMSVSLDRIDVGSDVQCDRVVLTLLVRWPCTGSQVRGSQLFYFSGAECGDGGAARRSRSRAETARAQGRRLAELPSSTTRWARQGLPRTAMSMIPAIMARRMRTGRNLLIRHQVQNMRPGAFMWDACVHATRCPRRDGPMVSINFVASSKASSWS